MWLISYLTMSFEVYVCALLALLSFRALLEAL